MLILKFSLLPALRPRNDFRWLEVSANLPSLLLGRLSKNENPGTANFFCKGLREPR